MNGKKLKVETSAAWVFVVMTVIAVISLILAVISLFIEPIVALLCLPFIVIFGGIGVIPLIFINKKKERIERLKANGKLLNAEFKEMKYGSISLNKKPGRLLICSYTEGDTTYFFKSQHFWLSFNIDVTIFEGAPVNVYADPDDYSNHFVDIDSFFVNFQEEI